MLKIPKQIYFDEPTLTLYTQYAQKSGKSFAAVIRETLEKESPKVKAKIAAKPKHGILDFYGAGKSPYKRTFNAREERQAFEKAMGENAAKEGLYE